MSGAYAKEFEKWLESNNTDSSNNVADDPDLGHTRDSEDEVDNLSGCESVSSLESQGLDGETAPFLSDDDNPGYDEEVSDGIRSNHRYEEEPPILEPVPTMPHEKPSHKSMVSNEATFSCFKTTSKGIKKKQLLSNAYKEEILKKKVRHKSEQERDITMLKDVKNSNDDFVNSKQGGNIFDKFNSISQAGDDVPPPLIPSPGAILTNVPSPEGGAIVIAKLPNSPDFCAMEADSTSEMCKSNSDDHHNKNDKVMANSQGDISLECDSTCMLGGSPNVLSPGAILNADIEDSGNQSDSQAIHHDPTREYFEESGPISGLNRLSLAPSSKSAGEEEKISIKSWDKECPTLEAVMRMQEENDDKLHLDTPIEEPPVLSVIPSPESFQALRRKRHTVDTVENMDSSAKRKYYSSGSCARSEKQFDIDVLEPPDLSQSVHATIPSLRDRDNKSHKSSSKKHINSSKKSHHSKTKHRIRSNSLIDLSKFVKSTSQLSHLQSQMHKLVTLLFPQIKSELEAMSPESIQFENVLISLLRSLQNTEDDVLCHNDSSCSMSFNRTVSVSGSSGNLSQCTSNSTQSCDLQKDNFLPPHISSLSTSKYMETDISSGHSMEFYKSSGFSQDCDDVTGGDCVIPKLSHLSLKAEKDSLCFQPSVIIKANVCETLKYFSRLTCNVLQLLLPDLSINLFNALGHSHNDLLNLIESVILINSG